MLKRYLFVGLLLWVVLNAGAAPASKVTVEELTVGNETVTIVRDTCGVPRFHGVYILPPGLSEDTRSPHYRDQFSLAGWWMFTPMKMRPEPPR